MDIVDPLRIRHKADEYAGYDQYELLRNVLRIVYNSSKYRLRRNDVKWGLSEEESIDLNEARNILKYGLINNIDKAR